MPSKKIVLDTNCLLVSISKYGEAYPVWRGFLDGRYTLCVSTEILEEYEEIIACMATPIGRPPLNRQRGLPNILSVCSFIPKLSQALSFNTC